MRRRSSKKNYILVPLLLIFFLAVGAYSAYRTAGSTDGEKNSPETKTIPGKIIYESVSPAADAARAHLAQKLSINSTSITLGEMINKEWSDGCLGLPEPGQMCTQQIVPGYEIILIANDVKYIYRTDESGKVVKFQSSE